MSPLKEIAMCCCANASPVAEITKGHLTEKVSSAFSSICVNFRNRGEEPFQKWFSSRMTTSFYVQIIAVQSAPRISHLVHFICLFYQYFITKSRNGSFISAF